MNAPLIALESVSKEFQLSADRSLLVLKDISLDLYPDDFISLVGPSGCGKSTLLNIMATLLKPTKGKVLYEGRDITHKLQKELLNLRQEIGYVTQNWTLEPYLTVWENATITNDAISLEDNEVMELIKKLNLEKRLNHYPSQLSGGEYRKTMLLVTLLRKPKVLIADEPTANVDIHASFEIMNLLQEVHETGTPVIFSTHSRELAKFADKQLKIKAHQIIPLS